MVLVSDDETPVSVAEKAFRLQKLGAIGVLVYASAPGAPVRDLNCKGRECDIQLNIPVASVPFDGELLASARRGGVTARLQTSARPNYFFSVSAAGRLVEIGWALYPSLEFLAWQTQWLAYERDLQRRIGELDEYAVPVFDGAAAMRGKNGTGAVQVQLRDVTAYNQLYLDAALGCEGDRDEQCPPWDHVTSLYVCCNNNNLCGTEVGRWITPFRRSEGRWLTDVSALLPVFAGGRRSGVSTCILEMRSDAWWAKAWLPRLTLRFGSKATRRRPFRLEPLFRGGTFDRGYNAKYAAHRFTPPADATKQ